MGFLEELPGRARAVGGHVVLVEGDNLRTAEAAGALCRVFAACAVLPDPDPDELADIVESQNQSARGRVP